MDGNSSKGQHQFNLPPSARTRLQDDFPDGLEALQEHCSHLDQKISSLTSKLSSLEKVFENEKTYRQNLESELQAARSKAKASLDVQSQFLDNMSHELRTPLNGILGMTQLMLEMPLSKEIKEHSEAILHSGQMLDGIITNMLDYSRLVQGGFELEPTAFNLLDCFDRIVSSHAAQAFRKGLSINLLAEKNVDSIVKADRSRLQKILDILLNNAIKFTHSGSVSVDARLALAADRQQKGSLVITVQDTGVGIDAAHSLLIYEPFWQAERSNTRTFGGIGMGLPLCRALVDLMDGQLSLESTLAVGSAFTVKIPLLVTEPATTEEDESLKSLSIGLYDITGINNKIIKEYLGWWDLKPKTITPASKSENSLAGLDIVITVHRKTDSARLMKILPDSQPGAHTPLIIGLCSPACTLRPFEKKFYDILLPEPILPGKLKDTLVYAVEILKSRDLRQRFTSQSSLPSNETHVLLVEPQKINQKILRHMLNSLGMEVVVIESLRDLEYNIQQDDTLQDNTLQDNTQQDAFSIVLVNISVNHPSDIQILSELERHVHLENSHKIIGITGIKEAHLPEAFKEAGISKMLTLPTSMDRIKRVMFG